jgi:phosphate transport system substrate-binding protein
VAWLLLLVAGAAALTGCGSPSSTSGSPAAIPPAASVEVGNPWRPVTLTESGSSLMLPYLQRIAGPIKADYPNLTLAPSAGGTAKAVSDAISGAVVLGGSDAYLSDGQAALNPDVRSIPIAVSAQAINYNVPGVSDLKLSGDVLARIYQGRVSRWNDPAIAGLNPGVALPPSVIVPVRRSDASGDTFIFTSFLDATNDDWQNGPAFSTIVTWPAVQGELTASGNAAMVQVCRQTPGCIAYVGTNAEQAAVSGGLGQAMLRNRAGAFVKPTHDAITAAVTARAAAIPPDLRDSLICADGAQSYPIVNYEYLLVKSPQADADMALAVRSVLAWAVDTDRGSSSANLDAVDFVALPSTTVARVRAAIAGITA